VLFRWILLQLQLLEHVARRQGERLFFRVMPYLFLFHVLVESKFGDGGSTLHELNALVGLTLTSLVLLEFKAFNVCSHERFLLTLEGSDVLGYSSPALQHCQ
jgi:hypothetical protein